MVSKLALEVGHLEEGKGQDNKSKKMMIIISIISKTRLRFNFFFCELLVKDGADVRCKFRSWASFDDQTFDIFSTS